MAPAANAASTLVQRPGTAGCIADIETGGCSRGRGRSGAAAVAVSPDGVSAYVPTMTLGLFGGIIERYSGQLTILDRAADGTLTQPPVPRAACRRTGPAAAAQTASRSTA